MESRAQLLIIAWNQMESTSSNKDMKIVNILESPYPRLLSIMINLLFEDEYHSQNGVNGDCLTYFLDNDILNSVLRLSQENIPLGLRTEVIEFMIQLISLLDGSFLLNEKIITPILELFRNSIQNMTYYAEFSLIQLESDTNLNLLELGYVIALKLPELPILVSVLFVETHQKSFLTLKEPSKKLSLETSIMSSDKALNSNHCLVLNTLLNLNFPILGFVLLYIHSQDQQGDYARAALVILFQYMTLKIEDEILEFTINCIIGSLVNAYSDTLACPLDNLASEFFVKIIGFIEDILRNSLSDLIKSKLLQDISTTFLSNVLLDQLQCASDYDGTSIALVNLLNLLARSIRSTQLGQVFTTFLLEDPEEGSLKEITDELSAKDFLFSKLCSNDERFFQPSMLIIKDLLTKYHSKAILLFVQKLGQCDAKAVRFDPISCLVYIESLENWLISKKIIQDISCLDVYLKESLSLQNSLKSVVQIEDYQQDKILPSISLIESDSTIKMLQEKFESYFNSSFDYNFYLLEILTLLCASPNTILFYYLVGMHTHSQGIDDSDSVNMMSTLKSHLVTVETQLVHDPLLRIAVESNYMNSNHHSMTSSLDTEEIKAYQKIRNIILLQEFSKQVMSIVYCQCVYTNSDELSTKLIKLTSY